MKNPCGGFGQQNARLPAYSPLRWYSERTRPLRGAAFSSASLHGALPLSISCLLIVKENITQVSSVTAARLLSMPADKRNDSDLVLL